MREFLDRDFIKTREGLLFCVIGCVHPFDRVISYLKYIPSPDGKWSGEGERYARTMKNYTIPSLVENLRLLSTRYPQYIFHSKVLNTNISAVPHPCIVTQYLPEQKLRQLLQSSTRDSLQKKAVQLVTYLSDQASIERTCFGITGSILTDIHSPTFSDIDLLVYGLRNGWKMKDLLQRKLNDGESSLTKRREEGMNALIERWSRNYHLTISEAREIYRRRWNHGFFKGTAFSIHTVKGREEVHERYGDKIFKPLNLVVGKAEITGVQASLLLPCIYDIRGFEYRANFDIDRIVSFNNFYSGIFDKGERVQVKGKLEKVVDTQSHKKYYRIVVGSLEARGQDYIKPIIKKA